MTYVIAEPCVDVMDTACVSVCPVDCIHFDEGVDRKLFIDPNECIDCGACEPECPVNAIFPEESLPARVGRLHGDRRPVVHRQGRGPRRPRRAQARLSPRTRGGPSTAARPGPVHRPRTLRPRRCGAVCVYEHGVTAPDPRALVGPAGSRPAPVDWIDAHRLAPAGRHRDRVRARAGRRARGRDLAVRRAARGPRAADRRRAFPRGPGCGSWRPPAARARRGGARGGGPGPHHRVRPVSRVHGRAAGSSARSSHGTDDEVEVLALDPVSIEGILNAIQAVGAMTEAEDAAMDVVVGLRERLQAVETIVVGRRDHGFAPPRLACARMARSAGGGGSLGPRAGPPGRRLGAPRARGRARHARPRGTPSARWTPRSSC